MNMIRLLIVLLSFSWIINMSYAAGPQSCGTTWADAATCIPSGEAAANPTEKKTEQSNNILGLSDSDLRSGNVNQDTISKIIVNIINVLLGVAGTVAIFSLIYHAVQMQINSGITGDSSGVDKAKKWMIGSLIGFVIAISAWFLVTRVVELLGAAS